MQPDQTITVAAAEKLVGLVGLVRNEAGADWPGHYRVTGFTLVPAAPGRVDRLELADVTLDLRRNLVMVETAPRRRAARGRRVGSVPPHWFAPLAAQPKPADPYREGPDRERN